MNITAGSPKPASACPSVSSPVAQSDRPTPIATSTTGSLFQTNRTIAAATIAARVPISPTDQRPQGRPARYQPASSTVHSSEIQMT